MMSRFDNMAATQNGWRISLESGLKITIENNIEQLVLYGVWAFILFISRV